jgi:hypothetical protein
MNKEIRVFVVSATDIDTNGYEIESWNPYEVLPLNALEFVKRAELAGTVYSLSGFQNAINLEELSLDNSWIFITNKY